MNNLKDMDIKVIKDINDGLYYKEIIDLKDIYYNEVNHYRLLIIQSNYIIEEKNIQSCKKK